MEELLMSLIIIVAFIATAIGVIILSTIVIKLILGKEPKE